MTRPLLPRAPQCVLFDLDGTLLDTEPLYTQASQAVCGRFGKVYDWSIKKHVVGGDARAGAAFTIAQLNLPITPEQYLRERDVVLHELFAHAPAAAGAETLVRALHQAGARLAIATSSERALCERKLRPHAWLSCIEAIVCAGDPGIGAAKPAPDLFLAAARALGASAEHCLVVEDAPNGVRAARAADMPVIAVVDPHMRDQDYGGALATFDSLEQVTLALLGY